MSNDQKPGDPADRAADGAFGGVQSHRAGYGDDRLQRLTEWLRAHPTATLASGEGALLLAEIDRLRARCRQIDDEAYDYAEQIEQLKAAAKDSADHYADARAEIDRLRDDLQKQADWADWAKDEIDRLRRILAALRADRESLSSQLQNCTYDRDGWKRRAERFERILAALREPSVNLQAAAYAAFEAHDDMEAALRAAVAAAEQEVGRE